MSSLRGAREDVSVIRAAEQSKLFRRAPATPSSWCKKFVCLSTTSADRVPSQTVKMQLEEAGLGEKLITVPDIDCSPEKFKDLLHGAFPMLKEGGGYELLRCRPQSRDLLLIGPQASNCPRLLKRRILNGKVYIRPIQRDLSLEPCMGEDDEVQGVSSI